MKVGAPLWPRLEHIHLSLDVLSLAVGADRMEPVAHRALMALVEQVAVGLVWTYTAPGDGSLPDDDIRFSRITGLSLEEWLSVRGDVSAHFEIKRRRWHLKAPWVAIDDRPIRFAIPLDVQRAVRTRQGDVCTYCGTTSGPFEFDHILPVSKGGSNGASNLTLACLPCNRSKGGRTLSEWMASR